MEIKIEQKTIQIKKLPLKKYADLLLALQELPKKYEKFKDFDKADNSQIVAMIPQLLGDSYPDLVRILTIATPLTKEEIESDDFGLSEFTDCIIAIIEVNNFKGIFSKAKKAMARFREQPEPPLKQ